MKSERYLEIRADQPHGTRARYVAARCRCDECRRANRDYYHDRMKRRRELEAEVIPSGPPGNSFMLKRTRWGQQKQFKILTCPGANGETCVKGGAWLKGAKVCAFCIERATVWNGLVSAEPARRHLMKLRRAGVGYKSVAAACDIGKTCINMILSRETVQIRRSTERAILAVDAGARADAALVTARKMNRQIAELRAMGFTLRHLGRLMGYAPSGSQVLQLGKRPMAIAATVFAVDKLHARAIAGELRPASPLVDAAPAIAVLRDLHALGLTYVWLSDRLGFTVHRKQVSPRMFAENAAAVFKLRDEIEELRREGEGLPENWQAKIHKVGAAFGFEGGWGFDQRTSKKGKKREEKELRALAQAKKTPALPSTTHVLSPH